MYTQASCDTAVDIFSTFPSSSQEGCFAGLHFTYPKDKKAALRAAEVLAAQQVEHASSDSSERLSLREHPDDVVSYACATDLFCIDCPVGLSLAVATFYLSVLGRVSTDIFSLYVLSRAVVTALAMLLLCLLTKHHMDSVSKSR